MCGRYTFISGPHLGSQFDIRDTGNDMSTWDGYNIGPGSIEPVVLQNSPNHIELMKWGLIPPWAKDLNIGYKMINARAETLLEKVSFKRPFKNRRCIIPISGFYEWKTVGKEKIPFYITPPDADYWALAGLYEVHPGTEGKEIRSYTIITTSPNDFMAEIHTRMPVILDTKDYNLWLDNTQCDESKLMQLMVPYTGDMEKRIVSSKVNSVANQGKELIQPVDNV